MRIISGTARGRKLKTPVSDSIRPTTDRVKEAIFNIIQFDIEGRKVLDLFAGTGQLGIEALSRGAACAVFVDSGSEAVRLVRENLQICGFSDQASVYAADALRYLEQDGCYDLILIDPPYDSELVNMVIAKIIRFDKLSVNGIIVCEIKTDTTPVDIVFPYELIKTYKYGNTELLKITRKAL